MNGFRPKESRPQQLSVPPMPSIAQPQCIQKCKYLLPCGICDKTNEICSQYGYTVTKTYSEVDENFGSWRESKEQKNAEDYISDEESAWEDQDYMI